MIQNFTVGQRAFIKKAFTSQEVAQFADISTDKNPIHLDETYAAKSIFRKRVVHGMLTSSLFSGLIGQKLPGKGSIYLSQSLNFKRPIFIDEEVTAYVEIAHVREDKPIITLKTWCENSKGEIAIEG